MRVLVTGGSGFLGLALCEALAARGDAVVSADLTPPGAFMQAAMALRVERSCLDVTDRAAVRDLMAEVRPDAVIHAAAATPDAAREAAGDAAAIVAVNVGGTANVVEAAAATGVGRVLALSSVAIYGRTLAEAPRLVEDMAPRPATLYAITKAAAEAVAQRLGDVHDVPVCAPRVGILWGRWEHRTSWRATPSPACSMFDAARAGRDVVLPQEATAPLLHVDAAVDALLALLGCEARGAVNVGAPGSVDLLGFARAVAGRYGVEARIDAGAANVPLLAADRPPADGRLLKAAAGHVLPPHSDGLIVAHDDWLAAQDG